MAKRWYVLHVYSGFEKKIASQIMEQAGLKGLSDHIDDVVVPTEEVVEIRRAQKVNAERKFFPGYVLIKMELTDDTWHLVKDVPKVTGFLGTKTRPSPITEAEAERIMKQTQEGVERPRPSMPKPTASSNKPRKAPKTAGHRLFSRLASRCAWPMAPSPASMA
jgi:transcriptional antiterminator NusG